MLSREKTLQVGKRFTDKADIPQNTQNRLDGIAAKQISSLMLNQT